MDTQAKEESFRKARSIVFRLLKSRPRGEKELRDKLATNDLPVSIVEQTIKYFKDCALINDVAFARQWTSSRLAKPFGLNRIRLELKNKGIDRTVIEETLKDALRGYDEGAIVEKLANHQAGKYTNSDPKIRKQRVYGYLFRRGFNPDIIVDVIKNI